MALTNVSISILRCDFRVTSIFRNRSRKKRSCSSVIRGFASFSTAILFSSSSRDASSSSKRSFVDRAKIPCWMAFSRLVSMAVFVIFAACLLVQRQIAAFSASCKVISAETIASMVASFISICICCVDNHIFQPPPCARCFLSTVGAFFLNRHALRNSDEQLPFGSFRFRRKDMRRSSRKTVWLSADNHPLPCVGQGLFCFSPSFPVHGQTAL